MDAMFTIDLEGRRALVTGGGQGVGRGIAHALASAGAVVVVNDLLQERAEAVVAEVGEMGGHAEAVSFDVSDYAAVVEAIGGLGSLDILVNNAGNAGPAKFDLAPFHESQPEEWDRSFA